MSVTTSPSPGTPGEAKPTPNGSPPRPWWQVPASEVTTAYAVDPEVGLSPAEVAERVEKYGLNRLVDPPKRPAWLKLLDQFRSGIIYILLVAAALAALVGDLKDPIVISIVLLINAGLGYIQEARAETAMEALKKMLVTRVKVRRGGRVEEVVTDDLVPGDIVLLDAGDRIPADGRLLLAANASIDEAALTGESVPVDKDVAPVEGKGDIPLGERRNLAFMNTTLVRGRAEMVVTGTGMATEMGKVAELLQEADPGPTPLQRQLGRLSKKIATLAIVAVSAVFALRLLQGDELGEAALGAVALAVAAIPEGLPAVVTVTLAIGVSQMAKRNAIVKRLHSVETLGSTTVICSDKTGTLTLNSMKVREVRGDSPRGLLGGALANDAALSPDGSGYVGDPTEGAIVVAAAEAGIDVDAERVRMPRIGEVPFDSATKFMATYHPLPDTAGNGGSAGGGVVVYAKGAPDVLMKRCTTARREDGTVGELDAEAMRAQNEELARGGLRVLAVASRHLPAEGIDGTAVLGADGTVADPDAWVGDLTLEALIGIADPPRAEARDAIRMCHSAGIDVKMITGDHAITAGAIAKELGIQGRVVTGEELERMSDEDLAAQIDEIGVCARVSPEHKVRIVKALKANGHVAAMTGDGVNDAAALRNADIGVAMGITGTEVTKEAGDMVLVDDNFATIVRAVERGRTIYDNVLKFVRFQLTTNLGAISTILTASLMGLPVPFTPIQVLWVNIIADGPPAMTLGVDPPAPNVMQRPPRLQEEPILTRNRFGKMIFGGLVMATGTIAVFLYARDRWGEELALSMTFTVFVLYQMANVFNARAETTSVFSRYSFTNWKLWAAVGVVLVLQFVAVQWGPAQAIFDTVELTATQWAICYLVALSIIPAEELRKLVAKIIDRRSS